MTKVLIIKLGALGDVVMATSLIVQIQKAHSNDEVWLLTAEEFADLFQHWENLSIFPVNRRGLVSLLTVIKWIRAQNFSYLYDLQSNDRTSIIAACSGVAKRIGNHPRFPYTDHPPTSYQGECHIFTRMNELLAAANIPPAVERPQLLVGTVEQKKVALWLKQQGLLGNPFVIMHAGSSSHWPAKRWPYYAELAVRFEQIGIATIWVGTQVDADLNSQLARVAGFDATNCFSILELVELGCSAKLAVTNDSGPMHILSASGIPVYAFFGPTSWQRSHALGQRANVLINQGYCSACKRTDKATAKDHQCLPGISPEWVWGKITRSAIRLSSN